MEVKKIILWVVIILDVVVVNGSVGYLVYKSRKAVSNNQTTGSNQIPVISTVDECGEVCKAYIEQRIASYSALRPTQGAPAGPSATPKVVYVPQVKSEKVRTTSYINVPGSGYTTANDWTDLPGTEFYFNPADYPALVEVYFEVNMKLFNGNGQAFVRLFDTTNKVAVQGSDVSTSSQSDTIVVSGKVTFWSGKNLIRVQAKTLTADTAIFTSGRLRIVTEN